MTVKIPVNKAIYQRDFKSRRKNLIKKIDIGHLIQIKVNGSRGRCLQF